MDYTIVKKTITNDSSCVEKRIEIDNIKGKKINNVFWSLYLILLMKLSLIIIIIGLIILFLGVIFYFQSKSIVGPPQSFMYSNPDWTINGFIIISMGLSLVLIGSFILMRYKK